MDIWLKLLIIFLIPYNVQPNKLVEKTSCLELARPSNEQFRMSCSQHLTYHCLLDETFTKEFEVCRDWKWIPEGHCAYFNTYGEGNIDGRPCEYSATLVCPKRQYSSAENTKYTACYVKKITSTIEPRARISQVTSNGISNRENSTYFPKSETTDKQLKRTMVTLPIVFGIFTFAIFIAVISFYFVRFKYFQRHRREGSDYSDRELNDANLQQQLFLSTQMEDTSNTQTRRLENEANLTLVRWKAENHVDADGSDDFDELENYNDACSFLTTRIEQKTDKEPKDYKRRILKKEIFAENTLRFKENDNEDESIDEFDEVDKGNTPKGQVGDTSISSERTASSGLTPVNVDSVTKNEEESADFKDASDYIQTEDTGEEQIFENKKTAKTASGSGFDSVTSDDDNEESTGVFDDTFESLRMKAPQTDAKEHEKLYDLLKGGTLTPRVMAAVIKKMTGKTVRELLDNENVQEKVENFLNDKTNHIARKKDGEESIHVSYALLRIFIDEKHHPKSGWGNPVKDKDIGIGDDIDRLFRIFTITEDISNPLLLSVESYHRVLDIMVETITRLDTDAQFKEDIQAFVLKYRSLPRWTNFMEYINNFGKK